MRLRLRARVLVTGWLVDLTTVVVRLARFGLMPVSAADGVLALTRRSLEAVTTEDERT